MTKELTEAAAAALLTERTIGFTEGKAIEDFAWELGDGAWTYESGLQELVAKAIELDRAQRPATLQHDERDLEVGVWPAHPDMAADGGPDAIVVQIDTGELTKRLRINVNDAPVWDGDPETDRQPGDHFHRNDLPGDPAAAVATNEEATRNETNRTTPHKTP